MSIPQACYFVYIPRFSIQEELLSRFSAQSKIAIRISHLLPPICSTKFATEAAETVFRQYASFIDDKHLCHAEFRRWQFKWEHEEDDENRKSIDSLASVIQTHALLNVPSAN